MPRTLQQERAKDSMPRRADRPFDCVIFGATGFTGVEVARCMHRHADVYNLRWAIAGRSKERLTKLAAADELEPDGILVGDVDDAASMAKVCEAARLVLNCTGPYRFYGEQVVRACIAAQTDYIDLCGEPEFIDRCMLELSDAAADAGVLVMHACAFDSIPADIGTLCGGAHVHTL